MRARLKTDFFDAPRPRVIAHRGASGEFPENTLPAFRAAAEAGAPYIELDVHLTRDGQIAVTHDESLSRIAGISQHVHEMTLAELNALDAARLFSRGDESFPFAQQGIGVPSLAQVFAELPTSRFVVEIKPADDAIVSPLLGVIDNTDMSRHVLIASEHQAPIDRVRELAPTIPTNLPTPEIAAFMMSLPPGAPPFNPHGNALQVPPEHRGWQLVMPETIAAAHALGLEVHVWTVNEPAEMRSLVEMGVDGIITDFPSRLVSLLS